MPTMSETRTCSAASDSPSGPLRRPCGARVAGPGVARQRRPRADAGDSQGGPARSRRAGDGAGKRPGGAGRGVGGPDFPRLRQRYLPRLPGTRRLAVAKAAQGLPATALEDLGEIIAAVGDSRRPRTGPRTTATRATRPKAGPAPADLNWFDDAVEVPRPGTAATRRLANRQRLFRWYVWGSVVLTRCSLSWR